MFPFLGRLVCGLRGAWVGSRLQTAATRPSADSTDTFLESTSVVGAQRAMTPDDPASSVVSAALRTGKLGAGPRALMASADPVGWERPQRSSSCQIRPHGIIGGWRFDPW